MLNNAQMPVARAALCVFGWGKPVQQQVALSSGRTTHSLVAVPALCNNNGLGVSRAHGPWQQRLGAGTSSACWLACVPVPPLTAGLMQRHRPVVRCFAAPWQAGRGWAARPLLADPHRLFCVAAKDGSR